MAEFKFTDENLQKIESILKRYPLKKPALMPVLYIAQEQNGFISNEVIGEVADLLEITPGEVLGVVTFYTMYHQKQMGKYHIQVCRTFACQLRGAEELKSMLKEKLGIGDGGQTEDGIFSLSEVECLGSCGTAPVMQINDTYYENLNRQKVDLILDDLRKKAQNG